MTTVCTESTVDSAIKSVKVSPFEGSSVENDVAIKYDLEKCVDWINARGLERVCLQFPDSLLQDCAKVALYLEQRLHRKVYILGDTTCGSCCVDEVAADHIKADGIVHFGHACLNPTARLAVFHILEKKNIDVEALDNTFSEFFEDSAKKIIIFYDVAYAHVIEKFYESLKKKYSKLTLSSLCCDSNVDFVAAKSDGNISISGRSWTLENGYKIEDYEALFIGENDKTLASLALSIPAKCWYNGGPSKIVKFEIVDNPWLKRRRYLVEKLRDARTVGIVVATLGIKNYLEALKAVKRAVKEKNKKSYMFSVGKPNPAKLANFPEVDVFVVIACPESEIFDSKEFYKPLLTPFEVELAFNDSREFTTRYCLDFRQILPGGANYVEFAATTDSDVSLITGEIRTSDKNVFSADAMTSLSCRDSGTVAAVGKAGAIFLHERSWKGVEQRIGEDATKPAEKGRCGLPVNYTSEPISKKS